MVRKASTLIKAIIMVLVAGLFMQLSIKGETTWAATGQDIERQTVPTRTFTPEPVTPTVPSPTATDTPVPPTATRTPIPPTPSVTPTPTSAAVIIRINSDTDVYNGPGYDYAIIGSLKVGDTVVVMGRNADGSWWQIEFQGGRGWVPDRDVVATAAAYRVPVVSVSSSGETAAAPSTLPDAGGDPWLLAGGALLLVNGGLLVMAGLQARQRRR